MNIITTTEKYEIAQSIFKSKNTIRAFLASFDSFSDVESIFLKLNDCFEEFKEAEAEKIKAEQEKLSQANSVKDMLDSMNLTLEEFNRLMVRSGHIGAVTLSEAQTEAQEVKPKVVQKRKPQPVYVFQFEHNGETLRTTLRSALGRKPADLTEVMTNEGLNPYSLEDCLKFAVNPTEAEVQDYLLAGGSPSLIQYPEDTAEEQEDIDVDSPEESFGNA
ncbi:hypothetical protein M2G70_07310 [Vibrio vulnificus]|nr:hypothetical protein [Vibrio vulnificus]